MRRAKGLLRSVIFGAEDSLVSTVGLLSGVSYAGLGTREIIISGVILILVEALSMGAGVYISEDSTNEIDAKHSEDNPVKDGVAMLISYAIAGLIPLSPYLILGNTRAAFILSILSALLALFLTGLVKGWYVKKHPIKSGLKIVAIGGIVIAISVWVGIQFS